jgi:hypothetical protein
MTTFVDEVPDACLDPWLLVELPDGEEILFGFATWHPVTGGLSWMRSSPVRELDEAAGRARTQSGRLYALGRRVTMDRLNDEEGRATLSLLVLIPEGLLAHGLVEEAGTREWLIARKWARHLKVDPPSRDDPDAVLRFLDINADLYASLRAGGRKN